MADADDNVGLNARCEHCLFFKDNEYYVDNIRDWEKFSSSFPEEKPTRGEDNSTGLCRRYPPISNTTHERSYNEYYTTYYHGFVTVAYDKWCGEFKWRVCPKCNGEGEKDVSGKYSSCNECGTRW